MTQEEFIQKAKEIHGDKYDYSKVEYVNSRTKICIVHPEYGEIWQKPHEHLVYKGGNPYATKRLTTETFIEKAKNLYGDKYDYSLVEYKNGTTKVKIICHEKDRYGDEHGEFEVKPADFLCNKSKCRKCGGNYSPKDISEFSENLFLKYPEWSRKYIIPTENNVYKNNKTKIKVFCNEIDKFGTIHGEFLIKPCDLVNGYGCPKCGNNFRKTTQDFIKQANFIHNNKFDYTKSVYTNTKEKVCIICHEKDKCGNEHGEFWQLPSNHLKGSGCPMCNEGKKSKKEIELYNKLLEHNLKIERWKTFEWLKYKKNLFLDIYLPDYNIAIEYQGEQHFVPVEKFGGVTDFKLRQIRDKVKKELCEKHGIKIFYLRHKINIDEIIDYINETSSTKKI